MQLKYRHIMFLPLGLDASHIVEFSLYVLPFILIYIWHIKHDHEHNTELLTKISETNKLLKEILHKLDGKQEKKE